MKEWQRDADRFEEDLATTSTLAGCSNAEVREKVVVFETAMGHILCLAYEHREAMQLSDLMLTIQHVRDCLHACEVISPAGCFVGCPATYFYAPLARPFWTRYLGDRENR